MRFYHSWEELCSSILQDLVDLLLALQHLHVIASPPPTLLSHLDSHYFSEDEVQDLTLFSSGSSLAAPLDSSTFSGSLRARAWPVPVSLGKQLFSSGRLNGGGKARRDSDSPDLVDSPANREYDHEDSEENEDSDDDLVKMKPMSLAATFDCFSDDD